MDMKFVNAVSASSERFDFFHRPNYSMPMQQMQAYKFELKITCGQEKLISGFAGSCRFVYNKALALQKSRYENGDKKLTYAGLCQKLTQWRQDKHLKWLQQAPSQALQQSLKDLDRAYVNFFKKRASFPNFKKRGRNDAFRFPQGIKLDQSNLRVFMPKLGWVRYRKSREVEGEIANVTISRSCEKWFISIQTEREVIEPKHPSTSSIGVDVGIAKFATLSNGECFHPVNSFKTHQHKLARSQRQMDRQKKFSNNWKKSKHKIARIHQTIANIRRDYLHKLTHTLSKNHALVCIEDLQVKNMSQSASGTIASPGKMVKAKRALNKTILDQGWGEFRRQLTYKQAWRGGLVVAVPPQYTSQTCPECLSAHRDNRKTQSQFICVVCGYTNNADVVGGINILRAGHARLACGERVQLGRSKKQEPTEVIQALVA